MSHRDPTHIHDAMIAWVSALVLASLISGAVRLGWFALTRASLASPVAQTQIVDDVPSVDDGGCDELCLEEMATEYPGED